MLEACYHSLQNYRKNTHPNVSVGIKPQDCCRDTLLTEWGSESFPHYTNCNANIFRGSCNCEQNNTALWDTCLVKEMERWEERQRSKGRSSHLPTPLKENDGTK